MAPKKKQEKMSLGNFLSDPSYGSWAEEMDDMPLPSSSRNDSRSGGFGSDRREFGSRSGGFGGGERDFGGDRPYQQREQLPLPSKPPFTAHLGNLSFDVTQADIEDYFAGCQVTSVRIVEDKIDRKPKGFGYVEFETLDGLKKALELNQSQFQGRNIRVSVADPPKDRPDGREFTDWTRKGPLPDLPSNQRRPSDRGYRQVDAASDAGSERGGRRPPPPDGGDGRMRDFGNWERKGPLVPTTAPPPAAGGPPADSRGTVRRNDRSFERRPSPSWGEGRSQDGSRPPRREFQERPPPVERVPTAAEMDSQWRARMKPDAPVKSQTPTPDPSTPSSPVATMAVPATRPRLNLQKRTVSDAPASEQAPAPASDSKASPFGAARPIDTATREKEIEEKRLALRQKKEEEDREREAKVKAEKAAAAAKAAEAASTPATAATSASANAAAPPTPRENGRSSVSKEGGKENGASTPVQGRSFEILRRVTDQENGDNPAERENDAGEDLGDQPANGAVPSEQELKFQEVAQDAVAGTNEQATPSAEGGEDDGWNTVTKPTRKGRGGSSRALAS